jgi:hypothetical protein
MRQHHFYFSPEQRIVSIARANCSDDSNEILSENDYIQQDFDFGLRDKHASKSNEITLDKDYLMPCNH